MTASDAGATDELDREILWLVGDLLTARYAPEGVPIERADCGTGAIVSDRFILDELGDFLQNVAAVTLLLGHPEPLEWAVGLVGRTAGARFRRGGLFEPFAFHRRRWRRGFGLGLAYPYWNLDTLTGLVALYEVLQVAGRAGDAGRVRAEIEGFLQALLAHGTRAGHLRYGFEPWTGCTIPLTSPQLTGYVAEELVRFARLAGQHHYLDAAAALLRAECDTPGFRRNGLFRAAVWGPLAPLLRPGLRLLGKRHFFQPMLTKDNTLTAFALLALIAARPDETAWARGAVETWRRAVDSGFRTGAGYFATYARPDGRVPVRLTFNHSMIEWDIEAHVLTGRSEFLAWAQEAAGRWVALQTARGLFPEGPDGRWRTRSFLDPQVDLSVNLLKLGELTGDRTCTEAAVRNFAAVRRDFRLPSGYAWEVDSGTGEVRQPVIEVKYLGLLLKGYLGLRHVNRGGRLRDAPFMWMLLRDR